MRTVRIALIIAIAVLALANAHLLARDKPLCDRCNVVIVSIEALGTVEMETAARLGTLAAERGVTFDFAYAAAPWSTPANASLITGYYPWDLGIWEGTDRIPDGTATLATRLKAAGYRTALFSNGFAQPSFGFGQGFDSTEGALKGRDDDALFAAAAAWLPKEETPSFAFIHTAGVTLPYGADRRLGLEDLLAMHERVDGPSEADAVAYASAYRESVAGLDEAIGSFLQALEEKGELANTIVIVTAASGERLVASELGLRAASLSDETLRVPLIFFVPGHPARVASASVETRSIPATVLDLVGVSNPDPRMGASLLPFLRGSEGDHAVLASTAKNAEDALSGLKATPDAIDTIESGELTPSARITPYTGPYQKTALQGRIKLLHDGNGADRVVNVEYDPAETRDLRFALLPHEKAFVSALLLKLITLQP